MTGPNPGPNTFELTIVINLPQWPTAPILLSQPPTMPTPDVIHRFRSRSPRHAGGQEKGQEKGQHKGTGKDTGGESKGGKGDKGMGNMSGSGNGGKDMGEGKGACKTIGGKDTGKGPGSDSAQNDINDDVEIVDPLDVIRGEFNADV